MDDSSFENLKKYIKTLRDKHVSDSVIQESLLGAGWNKKIVMSALTEGMEVPVPDETSKGNYGLWDGFLHAILFSALYGILGAILTVGNNLIDYFVPNTSLYVDPFYYTFPSTTPIDLFSLAVLIVTFPLFVFMFLYIKKLGRSNLVMKENIIRKLFIYGTLIFTFLFILGTLIGLVYSLLDGDMTLNWFLKLVNFLFSNSVIFIYLLNQIKNDKNVKERIA